MGLSDELRISVKDTFKDRWQRTDGTVVPQTENVGLGNKAKDIDVVILYADISASTKLVDSHKDWFSAEIYKNFLYCCSKIIRDNGGHIRSFDGDRVMGVFIGGLKNTSAAKTALKINWCVKKVIQVEHDNYYKDRSSYVLKHTCGIDKSKIMATRSGIRGNNDLVWVGRSANYAAALNKSDGYPTKITEDVYKMLKDEAKFSNGTNMWVKEYWKEKKINIYKSTYWWSF